jgi:3-dehydroquinate synthase class II
VACVDQGFQLRLLCLYMPLAQCMESQYINSRPFRVNAGAVHAYVQAPGGKTAYLSELSSGSEVLVADAAGRTRTAVVGRCKVEVRPMVRLLQAIMVLWAAAGFCSLYRRSTAT